MSDNGRVLVFSGSANPELTADICKYMHIDVGKVQIKTFSDGEIFVRIEENVRGGEVFLMQPTWSPGNNYMMVLLIMIDSFKRSSAKRITAFIPDYDYGRQHGY